MKSYYYHIIRTHAGITKLLGALLVLIPFFTVLAKLFARRISAFGCTDECFNIVAGYFITNGKTPYLDFFFNHQPIPAYLSAVIQAVTHPINIPDLFLKHHQFVIVYGFIFSLLLILRFGFVSLVFIVIFEVFKPYYFGDKFYGESFTVYPLVYLTGLVWLRLKNAPVLQRDILFATVCTWFILFTREPMTIAALFAYAVILFYTPQKKYNLRYAVLFIMLCSGTLLFFPLQEYIFNIFTVNKDNALGSELQNRGLSLYLKAFFYPLLPYITGPMSHMRIFLIGLSTVFLASGGLLLKKTAQYQAAFILMLFLGLTNPRPELPGNLFYVMFHMVNYFGVFIFVTGLLLKELAITYRKTTAILTLILCIFFLGTVLSPQSYVRDHNDPHTDFMVNLGHYLQWGEVIKLLADSDDTLFVDGWDELLYWQTGLKQAYPYLWYVSAMPKYEKYSNARFRMFQQNPPEFYVGSCKTDYAPFYSLPEESTALYARLSEAGKPSCIYVLNTKVQTISAPQWQKAKEWLFEIQ